MIAEGLPVYRWGKRSWVFSDDVIAFLRQHGQRADGEGALDSQSGGQSAETAGNGAGRGGRVARSVASGGGRGR